MKRFLCVLLVALMITPGACAEVIDLSSLSFDQLRELQQKINQEIVSRPEWKEVTVPAGTWEIGKDIPAGAYSLRYEGNVMVTIETYENGVLIDYDFLSKSSDTVMGKKEFKAGQVITISASLIFAPPLSLGF